MLRKNKISQNMSYEKRLKKKKGLEGGRVMITISMLKPSLKDTKSQSIGLHRHHR